MSASRRRAVLALALAGVAACEAPPADATCPPPGVARVWRPRGDAPTPVIVRFARAVPLPALAADGRRGRRRLVEALHADAARAQGPAIALLRRHGIEPTRLWMINAVAATLPAAVIDELARLPEVERIEPDRWSSAPRAARGAAAGTAWNLEALQVPALWAAGRRGDGSVVAILDTGVDVAHPALAGSWRGPAGWYDPYAQHATPFDASGHGTQVTGLVVGADGIGVAPGARWIAARIYDDAGSASLTGIHLALQWVLDPDGAPVTDDAPDVVVASWGFTELVDQCFLELELDLATLRAAQIANVVAAGNTGPAAASSLSPANNPSAFAVGGVDDGRAVLADSARGPSACTGAIYPRVVAPAANVRTTDLTFGGQFPTASAIVSGTSFAAPHLAGALALLRGAHPAATVAQLEDALTATAIDLAPVGADHASGAGLPDLVAAEARLAGAATSPDCADADGDGYAAEPACGTALDCDDGDAAISPGACDAAGDGVDQDCDGADATRACCTR